MSLDCGTSLWSSSLCCGGLAGLVSKFATYPLDTVHFFPCHATFVNSFCLLKVSSFLGYAVGNLYSYVLPPLLQVKKRMQVHGMSTKTTEGVVVKGIAHVDATVFRSGEASITKTVKHQEFQNSWRCFQFIFRHEGIVGLYRGILPSVTKAVPSAAFSFAFYEVALDMLEAVEEHS